MARFVESVIFIALAYLVEGSDGCTNRKGSMHIERNLHIVKRTSMYIFDLTKKKGFGQDPTSLESSVIFDFALVEEVADLLLEESQSQVSVLIAEGRLRRQELAAAAAALSVVQRTEQQVIAAQQKFIAAQLRFDLLLSTATVDSASLLLHPGD